MSETSSLAQVQVTICHHPTSSTSNYVTITVAQSALSAHQAHGDSIGRCIQWSPISVLNAPSARLFHTAVWTGTKMIIWGGHNGTAGLDSGGIYDPATDSWTAISTTNAPSGRSQHTAVWTGSRMIVWGGADSHSYFNDGGIFDPATNSWTSLSTINSPQGKAEHTAVWTGKKNDRLGRAYVCILGQAE
ncbi:MAG: hypothetical protein FJ116_09860 [Deltaproteobacteria bacterium]|nr:hypothetical protein [Deltaproteobacteria bacterium]